MKILESCRSLTHREKECFQETKNHEQTYELWAKHTFNY